MINSKTDFVCLLGNPVSHSKSPLMHNAALEKLGINSVYLCFEVEKNDLKKAVEGLKVLKGFKGANVTIPHKEEVIPYLDNLTDEAKKIGAVNTIYNKDGNLVGDNTDGRGFIISLMKDGNFDPQGKKAIILGAGGVSRAICVKLIDEGIKKIVITDIDKNRVDALTNNLEKIPGNSEISIVDSDEINIAAKESDLIVNCTPVGMKKTDLALIDKNIFNENHFVYDVIYNPLETNLLKNAKAKGAKTLNGKGMLVYQGALAFEGWFDQKPDTELMFSKM